MLKAHFNCAGVGLGRPPLPSAIRRNILRYAELGLSVNVSELDVRTSKLPENVDKDQAQYELYRDTVQVCYGEEAFSGVTFWGFTDKHTWVHEFYGSDRPLLWDEQYAKKKAYFAVQEGLQNVNKDVVAGWTDWMQPEQSAQVVVDVAGSAKPDWEIT